MTTVVNPRMDELSALIEDALVSAVPGLEKPSHQQLRERLRQSLVLMMEKYRNSVMHTLGDAAATYHEAERDLLVSFLDSLPNVSGSLSAADKDRIDNLLKHGLNIAAGELSPRIQGYIVSRFRELLKLYAGLSTVDPELADATYSRRSNSLLSSVKAQLRKEASDNAIQSLRELILGGLADCNLNLPHSQLENIADQMLWLLQDYVLAPESERDEVYRRGEERILISAFDPNSFQTSMSRSR